MKFYQKKYPNEDTSWLENLAEKQYDEILELLFENKSLDEIESRIDVMKKFFSLFMKI